MDFLINLTKGFCCIDAKIKFIIFDNFVLADNLRPVFQTASQTTTIVEECIALMRTLYSEWTQEFSMALSAKLATASDLLAHPLLNIQVFCLCQ